MAELVDALVLGTSEATRGGSSPLARTYNKSTPRGAFVICAGEVRCLHTLREDLKRLPDIS